MRLASPPDAARVLALFGPTAAGKSRLAHAVARELGGEIVVADPFQRYRGLEIAADSPRPAELAEVPYHLVGDLGLSEASSAGDYARLAHTAIDDILARGRVPVVAGGTGLYLRAALADLDFPEDVPADIRREVEALVHGDLDAAIDDLRSRDPAAADRVDLKNPRRIARALELARSGVKPLQVDQLWTHATRLPTLLIGVLRPRDHLDALIAGRVGRELADGLLAELEAAIDTPGFTREAGQIIGVKEVLAMRAGTVTAGELPALLAARTRKLARAQLTWLRKTPGIVQLHLADEPAEDAVPRVLALWNEACSGG